MRPLVVVSGSGRSGTSLAMQVLHACGLEVSDDMIPGSEANPRGAWEDRAIFAEQTRLSRALATWILLRPNDWREREVFREVRSQLEQILGDRLTRSRSIWGFKDPRASLFLPMWIELSSARQCELRLVLCIRQAQSVVASLMEQYGDSQDRAESTFMLRNLYALAECPPETFFLQYDDLIRREISIVHDLCRFCGLADGMSSDRLRGVMQEVCQPELDRARNSSQIRLSPLVRELDRKLQSLHGMPDHLGAVKDDAVELLGQLEQWRFLVEAARASIQDREKRVVKQAIRVDEQRLSIESRDAELDHFKSEVERLKAFNTSLKARTDRTIIALRGEIRKARLADEANRVKIQAVEEASRTRLQDAKQASRTRMQALKQASRTRMQAREDNLQLLLGKAVLKEFERPSLRLFRLPWKLVRLHRKHKGDGRGRAGKEA